MFLWKNKHMASCFIISRLLKDSIWISKKENKNPLCCTIKCSLCFWACSFLLFQRWKLEMTRPRQFEWLKAKLKSCYLPLSILMWFFFFLINLISILYFHLLCNMLCHFWLPRWKVENLLSCSRQSSRKTFTTTFLVFFRKTNWLECNINTREAQKILAPFSIFLIV